jgi:hypothetical protein
MMLRHVLGAVRSIWWFRGVGRGLTRANVSRFRQSDVQRALQGARKAKYDVAACTIGLNGSIRLVFRDNQLSTHQMLQDWDDVLK